MSKKESEFDRYERMRKLEREAEVEKRKNLAEGKKRGGRLKPSFAGNTKNWARVYDEYGDDEYY
ncbi:MAG: hypothetical protein KHZ62_01365 [Clostridiales bacterium]|nr:hypothetical protein [Clostridiales bacterium]